MSHSPSNLPDIRRYITAHCREGESVFLSPSQIPEYIPSKPVGEDGEYALLYATTTTPVITDNEADVAAYDDFLHTPPGITTSQGSVLRSIDLRPGKCSPMHRTVSVDYGIVIEGKVDLILDSGETRTLRRGDVGIQRGTAHSYRNRSETEWCRMLFMYLPMRMLNIKGKDVEEEVYDSK
ncbi:hypothetical protein ASPWEDRAFT_172780 [Aspergillus wentii DTO 134E9]|uniref:Cupin type-2 domain-containing protein n=1 Tax=Aspergillus wentii DTO 134E9 TaxID=1073089 RepID=A0A1L9RM33_ASPWE|nr:uncharacterized protein ASPWEDRAFT_172780 [Aspergillus wentii DTO 134E9]OJJ35996.1 hypothetical protein ASPWEDRAFT_172780 [Aspergillus wentii DTO 134E9]